MAPLSYTLVTTITFVGAGAASIAAFDVDWFPPVFFGLFCGQVVAEGIWWRAHKPPRWQAMTAAAACAFVLVAVVDLSPLVKDVDGGLEIAISLMLPALLGTLIFDWYANTTRGRRG